MESEINFLRQENARLIAKITGLEVENADVKTKYDDAINEITKLKAELKNRIGELEKVKLRDDNGESKQQTQDISSREVINIPSSVVDQLNNVSEVSSKSKIQFSYTSKQKILADKETDAFLNEVHKKRVSNEIRQRNRKEKLQYKSSSQEAHSIFQNTISTTSTTSHERKNEQSLI
ncbi:12213_t:CDS:2 [Ambispora leptoticha]|uniref:12213_t:CDS:1 n=1 Tax=Ambispora leptoticha TaxID=144679 RepID=A0A9N9EYQ2_9GLOM|nr:12213_t:CDS:2 [Ambispora leptoticha]